MHYPAQLFPLKNGAVVCLKTPEISDAAELLALAKRLAGETPFLRTAPEEFPETAEQEANWIRSYDGGPNVLIAVSLEGTLVGTADLVFFPMKKTRHRCEIGIAIAKEYWGLGIGSLLLDELIRLAKATPGAEQIELSVAAENVRAKRLYEKKGFISVGSIPRALRCTDGSEMAEERMIRAL